MPQSVHSLRSGIRDSSSLLGSMRSEFVRWGAQMWLPVGHSFSKVAMSMTTL